VRTQRIATNRVLVGRWVDFSATTIEHDQIESIARIRTTVTEEPFVDISIEEFTGKTRRAKYTSVRLEEEAARRLYELLKLKFERAS